MFEAINPLYWWGAAAVAAPIIIHLINRLRYRRVRWAAMEFLLKSMQRNRRKLVLQQLLLLLLRCALVMLVVILVVRPIWLLGEDAGRAAELPTFHVVLLDDSLSNQDVEDPQGKASQTAFREGTRLIAELARRASESSAAHYFTVLKLSNPQSPEVGRPLAQLEGAAPGQQIGADEAQTLRTKLDNLECSYLRLPLFPGLEEAVRYFANVKEGNRYLHVVSDFRRRDWTETDAEALYRLLGESAHPRGSNIQVRLHDVAHPRRTADVQETPRAHMNLGLTNLVAKFRSKEEQAESPEQVTTPQTDYPVRVVTPGIPVYLDATIRNFSDSERTGLQLRVKIDGTESPEFSRDVQRLAGGEERTIELPIRFGPADQLGFKQIAVYLDDNEKTDHLPADNIRYTYLELKKEVPVLLVDGDPASAIGDSFFLTLVFSAKPEFGLKPARIRPVEVKSQKNLGQYQVIFLLNVPGVGTGAADLDPDGLKALERYVHRGGSVVFFLGPRVNVASYNEHFYKNGEGIFPAPISAKPDPSGRYPFVDEPPDPDDLHPKVRFVKEDHPAFDIYKLRPDFLIFLTVNRYFKVEPNWKPAENASIVARLQNRQPLANYQRATLDLVQALNQETSATRTKLNDYGRRMSEWMTGAAEKAARKGPLIEALGALLDDPALVDYWADSRHQTLRRQATQLLEQLTTGDPLIIESALGKGRIKGHVMAFFTSAAPTPIENRSYEWNNWATLMDRESFVPYVVMLLKLQRYMAALSHAANETPVNRILGSPLELRLDKQRYDQRLQLWFHPENQAPAKIADLTGREEGDEVIAQVTAARGPGFYLVRLNQPPADGSYTPRGEAEDRPLAFNVDNRDEGNLSRIAESELHERLAAALSRPGKEEDDTTLQLTPQESLAFAQSRKWFETEPLGLAGVEESRSKSWSDYAWVLLLFFAILLVEQWLAMKLSYHLKDEIRPVMPVGPAKAA